MPISPELRNSLHRPMTEDEYFAVVNELLKDAHAIGAYCLAFGEVLRRRARRSPPVEVLERLVICESIREGVQEYESCLRYIGKSD